MKWVVIAFFLILVPSIGNALVQENITKLESEKAENMSRHVPQQNSALLSIAQLVGQLHWQDEHERVFRKAGEY